MKEPRRSLARRLDCSTRNGGQGSIAQGECLTTRNAVTLVRRNCRALTAFVRSNNPMLVAAGQIMTRLYACNSRRLTALVFSMALLIAPLSFASVARSQALGYPP